MSSSFLINVFNAAWTSQGQLQLDVCLKKLEGPHLATLKHCRVWADLLDVCDYHGNDKKSIDKQVSYHSESFSILEYIEFSQLGKKNLLSGGGWRPPPPVVHPNAKRKN